MADNETDMNQAPRIQLHFNVHEPIEMIEMTLAFQSIAHEYQTFLREKYGAKDRKNLEDVKLYITRIESNCILAELVPAVAMMGKLSALAGHATDVIGFLKLLTQGIKHLRSLAKRKTVSADDVNYDKRQVKNLQHITRLVAQNKNSGLGLKAIQYESEKSHVLFKAEFNSDQCNEAQRGAETALRALDANEQAEYPGVVMYFQQTNREDPKAGGNTGDRAIIKSIADQPKRVHFLSTVDHERIRHLLDDRGRNPLQTPMVVDVSVERNLSGNPLLYRVLRLIEVLEPDEEEQKGGLDL